MENLGIVGIDHIGLACRNNLRHGGLLHRLGFDHIADRHQNHESIAAFAAGPCQVRCVQPVALETHAADFLATHTDGVYLVTFQVRDIWSAAEMLARRGACFTSDIEEEGVDGRQFDITTPIGGVIFRFVETVRSNQSDSDFTGFDHLTCHFPTMAGAISWFEAVMGFRQFWRFRFHTRSDCPGMDHKPGTGMNSCVVTCPESGVKFALNEPLRPDFRRSQVWKFCQDHGGPGIQHIALNVRCVGTAVERLGPQHFLSTPSCYYEELAHRFARFGGLGSLEREFERMQRLGVLADAEGPDQRLLQIFMQPFAALHGDKTAGPMFWELIERRGALGFGEGNFRALFEAIERTQG